MSFYIYNDNVGVGRRYWRELTREFVMPYEHPTIYRYEEAENVLATFVLLNPMMNVDFLGVVDILKVGNSWTT